MKTSPPGLKSSHHNGWWLALCAATLLSACGGGGMDAGNQPGAGPLAGDVTPTLASATTTLQLDVSEVPDTTAQPSFHVAPVVLNEPGDEDPVYRDSSIHHRPHTQAVPAELEGLPTHRLTLDAMQTARHHRWALSAQNLGASAAILPMASSSVVSTYTPAQIRAAYGLPALPAASTTLTAAQAAQLGAGQTIYIVDAMHDPNVVAELAAFNQKFALPACTTKAIASSASLPLAAASTSGCELSVVYNTAAGAMTSSAPAYDSGWATEITLDVQWAHATAPLARIIVIEAPDASINSLLGSIQLANAMGPGIVSMSFGAQEGSWTASVDAAFSRSNMTYLAATGDSGAAVSWPSVSNSVVAVGGTTLTYSGTGTRSEASWSGTGGGTSAYTPKPSYQTSAVPGMGSVVRRTVADVAFNADPSSGQYVAVMSPGSSAVSWLSAGGTSLSTPQWAGIIAVANAIRAQSAKPVLGSPHAVLYGQIATSPSTYASAFADVTKGSDGSCATCTAKTGYDPLSGLGTPNVSSLLTSLTGTVAAPTAPVVTSAGISSNVGTALSFTVSVTAPNAVTYALSGAPSGMSISTAGVVTWATPVAGTYAVTVTAKDTKTGLSGSGVYTVTITNPPPVITATSITGKVGTALSFTVAYTAPNPVTFTLSGAPTGMAISSTGVVTWASPVAGNYNVTVTARDSKTGLTGQGVYAVAISAPQPPVVTGATITGKPGTALTFTPAVTAANPVTYSLGGAPTGMSISTTGVVTWASPVLGSYTVTVIAKDTKTGLSGQGIFTVKIATAGPVITAAAMTGLVGKQLTGTISISDPTATSLSVSITGVPLGMMFSVNGLTITAIWPSPVLGSYSLKVSVVDSAGLTATATIPITVK